MRFFLRDGHLFCHVELPESMPDFPLKKRWAQSGSHVLLLQVGFLGLPSLTSQAFSKLRHDELALASASIWIKSGLQVFIVDNGMKHETWRSLSYNHLPTFIQSSHRGLAFSDLDS